MRITIVGGGNIGTQFAVHCCEKGHQVTVFTSQPELFQKRLYIVNENNEVIHEGEINIATNDPVEAFRTAELILVTVPSLMMEREAEQIYKNASSQSMIGVVPGNGGSECAFSKCIKRGNVFFGIERVPAIARLVKKGECVRSVGYREELHVASIPKKNVEQCCRLTESIFDIPTKSIPCYLNLTMTPSNPILHTTRLKTLFSDYRPGVSYTQLPLFYEEWDDASSKLLIECDNEVQDICRALPEYELSFVKSLQDHYESHSIEAMTKKISSIPAFKGLKTPYVIQDGKMLPDLHSRYFTADFSYGLSIIKQIAVFAQVKTPVIDSVLDWYQSIAVEKDSFKYSDYGIETIEDFSAFYLQ